jgi:hypothetical protein
MFSIIHAVWRVAQSVIIRFIVRNGGAMTDHQIAFWTLIFTALCVVAAWLALPQIQEWLKKYGENKLPITLGNLGEAAVYDPPLPPGLARADRRTLEILLSCYAQVDWAWFRDFSFGSAFEWSAIAPIQLYALQHSEPSDEFIDPELEKLRSTLVIASNKFMDKAVMNTFPISRSDDDQTRKIADKYPSETFEAAQKRFFQKMDEINGAAGAVCAAYDALVRRARKKLAVAEEEGNA